MYQSKPQQVYRNNSVMVKTTSCCDSSMRIIKRKSPGSSGVAGHVNNFEDEIGTGPAYIDVRDAVCVKVIRDALENFAYSSKPNPIPLYDAIMEFKALPTGIKVVAQSIVQLHLKGDMCDGKITLTMVNDIISAIDDCPFSIPLTLFDKVLNECVLDMSESLEKFLQSSEFDPCMRFLINSQMSPVTSTAMDTSTDDSEHDLDKNLGVLYDPNIIVTNDKDFDRLINDINDVDMWKSVYKSSERTVSVSQNVFFNEGRKNGLKKMMETGIIPFNVDEVFHAYVDKDYIKKIESEISRITEIDYQETHSHAMTVLRFEYKLPFFLRNRDFCLIHILRLTI
ncbi:hypothetical protein AKO1_005861, partial [Acrasis kona]